MVEQYAALVCPRGFNTTLSPGANDPAQWAEYVVACCGPGGPWGPWGPVAPVGPVGPVEPWGPAGPVNVAVVWVEPSENIMPFPTPTMFNGLCISNDELLRTTTVV